MMITSSSICGCTILISGTSGGGSDCFLISLTISTGFGISLTISGLFSDFLISLGDGLGDADGDLDPRPNNPFKLFLSGLSGAFFLVFSSSLLDGRFRIGFGTKLGSGNGGRDRVRTSAAS